MAKNSLFCVYRYIAQTLVRALFMLKRFSLWYPSSMNEFHDLKIYAWKYEKWTCCEQLYMCPYAIFWYVIHTNKALQMHLLSIIRELELSQTIDASHASKLHMITKGLLFPNVLKKFETFCFPEMGKRINIKVNRMNKIYMGARNVAT